MGGLFIDDRQLQEWVVAAEGIKERFGTEKALGYVIGEKFHRLLSILHDSCAMVRQIEGERKKFHCDRVGERTDGDPRYGENLDETHAREKEIIAEAEELLARFAALIRQAFRSSEIREYLESHPRFGALGHIASDQEYDFMIRTGAVEHSLETELEDALALGEMLKYFGITRPA